MFYIATHNLIFTHQIRTPYGIRWVISFVLWWSFRVKILCIHSFWLNRINLTIHWNWFTNRHLNFSALENSSKFAAFEICLHWINNEFIFRKFHRCKFCANKNLSLFYDNPFIFIINWVIFVISSSSTRASVAMSGMEQSECTLSIQYLLSLHFHETKKKKRTNTELL